MCTFYLVVYYVINILYTRLLFNFRGCLYYIFYWVGGALSRLAPDHPICVIDYIVIHIIYVCIAVIIYITL